MSDILYDAFHLGGGGFCDASTQILVLGGTLRYNDEVLAWHDGDSKDYFYVQLPRIDAQITHIIRRIMPELRKNFWFEEGTLYKVYKTGTVYQIYKIHRDGTIESSDSTFEDMAGVL